MSLYAQKLPVVSEPRPELRGNLLLIHYDILYSDRSQRFLVELEITYPNGTKLNTRTLSGDIGTDIEGGENKKIIWDLEADRILIDNDILIKINAEIITGEPESGTSASAAGDDRFSRASLMLRSVVFPGWGLSMYRGGPHWIKGVAGYGCIAGSIYYNRMAVNTYNQYKDQSDSDMANRYYELAVDQDQISEVLMYTAIGIWVADLIRTFVATSDLSTGSMAAKDRKISLMTGTDPYSVTPLLGVRIRL
jgi:hypothetical protein